MAGSAFTLMVIFGAFGGWQFSNSRARKHHLLVVVVVLLYFLTRGKAEDIIISVSL